jgi:hypothetical protein
MRFGQLVFMKDIVGMPVIIPNIMRFLPVCSKLRVVAHTLPYDAAVMAISPCR